MAIISINFAVAILGHIKGIAINSYSMIYQFQIVLVLPLAGYKTHEDVMNFFKSMREALFSFSDVIQSTCVLSLLYSISSHKRL